MAQTGYTPISLYYSSTASTAPTSGNLIAGELAINTADGILYYKDSSGVVQVLANKNGINNTASGTIQMWPTTTAPTGYLLCNGAAVSRTTYALLFAVVGTTFGVGDGSTTFNLPNYTNRMPYGTTIGATGGSADAVVVSHTHTATSTVTDPGHAHSMNGSYQAYGSPNISGVLTQISSANTATATTGITVSTSNTSTGVSGTNANLPPYLGINFIIKV
jgi:microcystin-dependent protein